MEHLQSRDGSTIRYIAMGNGPAIIFLHGWTSTAREWLSYAADLADDHRVICWDARGHGLHPIATGVSTHIERMAQDLNQLIRHNNLSDVTLVGHSMGALTAWEYIRQFGCGDLGGLVVLDQTPKLVTDETWSLGVYGDFDTERNRQFIQSLHDDFAEGMLRLVCLGRNEKSRKDYEANTAEIQRIRAYQQKQAPLPLIHTWESLAQQDYREVLPTIDVPALLIYGDQSQFYDIPTAEYVASQIPDSELKIYENADHSPHLAHHRERFLRELAGFVGGL